MLPPTAFETLHPRVGQRVSPVVFQVVEFVVNPVAQHPVVRVGRVVTGTNPQESARATECHTCVIALVMPVESARLFHILAAVPQFLGVIEQLLIQPGNFAALEVVRRTGEDIRRDPLLVE